MAIRKILARDFTFEVESSTPGTFIEIGGINTAELPAPEPKETDVSTFDTDGWDDYLITGRGLSITLNGFRLEDAGTGARDPGQERAEALGRETGDLAEAQLRITSPGGKTITGLATFSAGGGGGGVHDASSFSCATKFIGKPTFA